MKNILKDNNTLIAIMGPSLAGKNTMIHMITSQYPDIFTQVLSVKNRSPRSGEQIGVDYQYMNTSDFQYHISQGDFAEYNEYQPGKYYGTLISDIRSSLNHRHIIKELDPNGYIQLLNNKNIDFPYLGIYLDISIDTMRLRRNNNDRSDMSDENLASRIDIATREKQIIYDINNNPSYSTNHIYTINANLDVQTCFTNICNILL